MGIVCLSENSDHLLMCAHYSGYNGFVINFKTKRIENLFHSIYSINYVLKFPYINIVKATQNISAKSVSFHNILKRTAYE